MTTSILFLCPHNAAKSVFAAAYAQRLATEAGLTIDISTSGTEPDPELLPIVRERLAADGYLIDSAPPSKVRAGDLDGADMIVNIGCDHDDLPTAKPITEWQIPNFSDGPPAAFAALEEHVETLIEQLDRAR